MIDSAQVTNRNLPGDFKWYMVALEKDVNNRVIAIVDDNSDHLELLQLFFQGEENYRVKVWGHGAQVYKYLDGPLPDIILLDYWMPGPDGLEICLKIKSDKRTQHIPVIMLSALPNMEARSLASGADVYISKPFHLRDLLSQIEELLN